MDRNKLINRLARYTSKQEANDFIRLLTEDEMIDLNMELFGTF